MKEMTPEQFDDLMRQRLEQHEMPYNASAWSRFEANMPKQPTTSPLLRNAIIGTLAVGAIAALVLLWPDKSETDSKQTAHQTVTIEQNSTTEQESQTTVEPSADATDTHAGHVTSAQIAPQTSVEQSNPLNGKESMEEQVATPATVAASPETPDAIEKATETQATPDRIPSETRPLTLSFKMSKSSVCVGEAVDFLAISNTGGLRYAWTFSDGGESDAHAPSHVFRSAGSYEVSLTASSNNGTRTVRTETIEVRPAPKADIQHLNGPNGDIPVYEFATVLQTGETCIWKFSDGRVSNEQQVRQLFRERGTPEVSLSVTNAHGCSVETSTKLSPVNKEFKLFAPDGFTPNADGTNDDFLPKALLELNCAFSMTISDTRGKEIFRTTSIDIPWDGRGLNGVALPDGLYFWTVVLEDGILHRPVFTGDITIQR